MTEILGEVVNTMKTRAVAALTLTRIFLLLAALALIVSGTPEDDMALPLYLALALIAARVAAEHFDRDND